jgi:hypothetical protein
MITPERFLTKVLQTDSCWDWQGDIQKDGYGKLASALAHRLSYRLFKSEIPADLTIDHLCRNRRCVNPDHLEVVTKRINTLRGISPSAIHARKTHCPYGHPYDLINTRWYKGTRHCRECSRKRGVLKYAAKRRLGVEGGR